MSIKALLSKDAQQYIATPEGKAVLLELSTLTELKTKAAEVERSALWLEGRGYSELAQEWREVNQVEVMKGE